MSDNEMTLPDYCADLEVLKRIKADVDAVGDGADLYFGVHALRTGAVAYGPNKSGKGYGWKGVSAFATLAELAVGNVSKIVKVVHAKLPDALTCAEEDVKSLVLMFVADQGSWATVYDAIQKEEKEGSEGTPKAYNGQAAFQTVITRLKNDGMSQGDINALFDAATAAVFG